MSLPATHQLSQHTSKLPSKRPAKAKPVNPIEAAIRSWITQLPATLLESLEQTIAQAAISAAPKRWVVYPPMLLLPAGSFDEQWWYIITSHPASLYPHQEQLWKNILGAVAKREGRDPLTHLAVNAGIPLHKPDAHENILRTPGGLVMLHGDFGPALLPHIHPTEQDFREAFWVSTKQNGIIQVWAPRYTMFSRGNVKEKARLLDFHTSRSSQGRLSGRELGEADLGKCTALDFYAGIGYFVFSYAKLGMRVLGWELNPWSVEGLRRGAVANGWAVRIVGSEEHWSHQVGNEKIVVFSEDNTKVLERTRGLDRRRLEKVLHINGGLLPTSQDSWETALASVRGKGWLHLHENVGVNDLEPRRAEIEGIFKRWLEEAGDERLARVEHIEQVKTFAPGVWHCVFDVYISSVPLVQR